MNEALPFVLDYMGRQRLAKMGFTESLDNLDCITAEALLLVDAEVETLKGEQFEKSMSKLKFKR